MTLQDVNFAAWLRRYKERVARIASSGVCRDFQKLYDYMVRHYDAGMDSADRACVCHGDLFPPNVLVTPRGAGSDPAVSSVIDWSCAVVTTRAFDVGVTQAGFHGVS